LFGDGAGAAVISPTEDNGRGILHTELHADGRYAKALCMDIWDISRKPYLTAKNIEDGDIYPKMDGSLVFKHAVTELVRLFQRTIAKAEVRAEDIKYIIPHQANLRINQMVAKQLGLPGEKVRSNIQRCANTTAASIPILLDETYRSGLLEEGDLILLLAFGSGFTWASALLHW
jgi:3-oxoacyl-[acyl-carrier-protein] synthase-3